MADSKTVGASDSLNVPKKSQWLTLAIWSGTFAAFNGVFAKLTTASQTLDIATSISYFLDLESNSRVVEILIRGLFFGLNLISNAIMWIFFTQALTASSSSTRVSIINVSSNFLATALLGMLIFAEDLAGGWWLGACFLIAGSVVIGRRESEVQQSKQVGDSGGRLGLAVGTGYADGKSAKEKIRFRLASAASGSSREAP